MQSLSTLVCQAIPEENLPDLLRRAFDYSVHKQQYSFLKISFSMTDLIFYENFMLCLPRKAEMKKLTNFISSFHSCADYVVGGVHLCLPLFASLKAKRLDPRGCSASSSRCRLCSLLGIIRHLHRRPRMRPLNRMSCTFSNTYLELRSLFQHFSLKVKNGLCNKEWWKNLKLEIQWHSYYFLIMLPRERYLTSPCLNLLSIERGW